MIATILVLLVALIHVYIVVLEMVLWTTPTGRRVFGTTEQFAAESKVLAANQGLYNGFLVAGLAWALLAGVPGDGRPQAIFFLGCVFVAGVYGGLTASRRILYVQALPAMLGLIAIQLA